MLRIAQVSDLHLLPTPESELRGTRPWPWLRAILNQVNLVSPDLLVLTGDLAEAGSPMAYQLLVDLITPLNIPTLAIPGNHDDPQVMRKVLSTPPFLPTFWQGGSLCLEGWRILVLDSVIPGDVIGRGAISPASFHKLRQELARASIPTVIALHHHPIPTGIDWVDQMQVQNAPELVSLLGEHPCVKGVIFGHIHMDIHHKQGSLDFYGCPSTSTQVIPAGFSSDRAAQDPLHQQPGFRLLSLFPDGSHHTEVRRWDPHD